MSVISLLYDGYEIIQDTLLGDAYFESIAGGSGGQCRFRVKDSGNIDAELYGFESNRVPVGTFHVGLVIELRIDTQLVWSGLTTAVSREFFFDVDDTSEPTTHQRYWAIEGMDWNVLFSKRVVWNVAAPTEKVPSFTGTEQDGDVVKLIMSTYMDLAGDGIADTGVVTTGPLSPFSEPFNAVDNGDQWGTVMNRITASNGTIYYIDPDKVLQYRDVEIATAPFSLSDQPLIDTAAGDDSVGYRNMRYWLSAEQMGNDALMWGAGQGSADMVFARVTDDETSDLYGVFQHAEMASEVWKQETIDLRASSYVYGSPTSRRGHREPLPSITVTVFQPGFRAGQVVHFRSHIFDEDTLPGVVIVDPGTTVPANLNNFAERIGHIESNNTYTRQNKSSGAYGCYQIMPGNWRVWGPEFLGTNRADAESSNQTDGATWIPSTSPSNQDTVAKTKFSHLYDWLGDWRRVAAFWRAGHESIRQPSEWSRGTILYVNHACVPLGYPPVTPLTVLPDVGSSGNDAEFNAGIGYTPNVSGEFPLPIRRMEVTFPTPTDAMFTLTLGDVFDQNFLGVDPTQPDNPSKPPDDDWYTETIPVDVFSPGFGIFTDNDGSSPPGAILQSITRHISFNEDGQSAGSGGGVYSSVGIKNGTVYNVPFTQAHCGGIGPGAYTKYEDREQWTKLIDDPSTRQAIVNSHTDYEITLGSRNIEGYVPSLVVRLAYGTPTAGRYGDGIVLGTITPTAPYPPDVMTDFEREADMGSVLLRSSSFDTDEDMWIVVSPGWASQRDGYYCDPVYYGGPAVCISRGPRCTGEGNSGVVALTTYVLSAAPVYVSDQSQNVTGGATWFGAGDGNTTIYRTQYPYVVGTLTVQWQGVTVGTSRETDPPNGLFVLPAGFTDQTGFITVTYRRADIAVTNPPPPQLPPGEPGAPFTPPPGDPNGNAYRPANQRQFGWGTIYDSTNCNMACASMALDRHTLGQYTRFRGSPQNIPPNMRIYSGNHGLNGTGHDDTQRAWSGGWGQGWTYGGPSQWSTMVANIASGRGCTVFGRYLYMDARYKKSRTYNGAHAIYINEQLSDGSFWGYDPIVGYPIVYPYDVLRTYAESYYGFSGRTASGFTRVTPNI